jgi:epoxyqueuosine reductase
MQANTEALKECARRLGFVRCGVTSAAPLKEYSQYARWVESDRHARMSYLSTEKAKSARADPRLLVPEAQSIVVCAAMYPPPTEIPDDPRWGGIAAYAVGDDYHDLLSERLWKLCRWMDEAVGRALQHRVYTDSGPVLERALAVRAGLGWIGKNSMVIHPRLGSHFFLAEIITEYPFLPDAPEAVDRCGTCEKCIAACPTGCILPDRTLDANRCLAYLTIEHRGAIPETQRQSMGRWVFGCDICQSVCPWNHHPPIESDAHFLPRSHLPYIDLAAELDLDESGYTQRFSRSPLRRARRDGYRRNVIIAAGNAGIADAAPGLARALVDSDPMLRAHAAWSLGRLATTESIAILRKALPHEQDAEVSEEIGKSLYR